MAKHSFMSKTISNNEKGSSIIEVMMAISLFSIGFMSLMASILSGSQTTRATTIGDISVMAGQDNIEMLSVLPMDHDSLDGTTYTENQALVDVEWGALGATDSDSDGTPDFTTIAMRVSSQGELKMQSYYRRRIN